MADNVGYTPGTGATVAADDVGSGVLVQRVKPVWGVDGSAVDTSATNPLPVVQTGTPGLPTGAATAAGQVTIADAVVDGNVSLSAINANTVALAGTVAGTEMQVDVVSSALPTGAATAAIQTSQQTALDSIDTSTATSAAFLSNVSADTADIVTSVQLLDNAISGSEMQVDVVTVPADPFGVNADAVVAAGAAGSIQAKLRRLTTDLDAIKTSVAAATPAGSNNIGDVDVLTVPADPFGANADAAVAAGAAGSIQAKLRRLTTDIDAIKTSVAAATPAGTNNIGDVDVLTLPNVTLAAGTNTNEVVGDAAEDAALAGNPVRVGMRASTAVPTAVSADNDVVTPWANRNGAQVVVDPPHVGLAGDPWTYSWKRHTASSAQTGTAIWTPAGGKRVVVTLIQIGIGGTVAGTMTLWFGGSADTTYTAGTDQPVFEHEFAPSTTLKPGVVLGNGGGVLGMGAADEVLRITTTNALVQTIVVHGYEI